MEPVLASVSTTEYKTIEKRRDTAYGILPIWEYPTSPRDFYVWSIPANIIFPFRPFLSERGQDMFGNILYEVERLPDDQIMDLEANYQFFINLKELRDFSESDVIEAAKLLYNPKPCDKYPLEIGNKCITCWLQYLDNDFHVRLKQECADKGAAFKKALIKSAEKMRAGFIESLGEARRRLDRAIREIDDPKSGKTVFFDSDLLNVYHTHSDRPKYKTTVNENDRFSEVLKIVAESKTENLTNIISTAVELATKPLLEKIQTLEKEIETKSKTKAKPSD